MIGDKHVVPRENGWGVKAAGGKKASKIFPTKAEATQYAKELAIKHKVCMVLHEENSKFEKFDCKPEIRNQHVVPKEGTWAVVSAGGKEISKLFGRKGAAMAHAYDIAARNNVCMLVHDSAGKFKSVACAPDKSPGILELVRMKVKY